MILLPWNGGGGLLWGWGGLWVLRRAEALGAVFVLMAPGLGSGGGFGDRDEGSAVALGGLEVGMGRALPSLCVTRLTRCHHMGGGSWGGLGWVGDAQAPAAPSDPQPGGFG